MVPPGAKISVKTAARGLGALKRFVEELSTFDPSGRGSTNDPLVSSLEAAIESELVRIFGSESYEFQRIYRDATILYAGEYTPFGATVGQIEDGFANGRARSIGLLKRAIAQLEDVIADADETLPTAIAFTQAEPPSEASSRAIFVVHGRNDAVKLGVARTVEALGYDAVLLGEEAHGGKTIIEKFERHGSRAAFAIVLLTPDDEGRLIGDPALIPRPRQNVVLELGYFIGRLGRERVMALVLQPIEIPSDISGLGVTYYDGPAGGWRLSLAHEMAAAGLSVDANRLIKSNQPRQT